MLGENTGLSKRTHVRMDGADRWGASSGVSLSKKMVPEVGDET